jgi:hypothetical protein
MTHSDHVAHGVSVQYRNASPSIHQHAHRFIHAGLNAQIRFKPAATTGLTDASMQQSFNF